MANALQREIRPGEPVVTSNGRVFVVGGGFGMKPYLSGTALIGHYLGSDPTKPERIDAYDIDAEATEALARGESPNRVIRLQRFLESLGATPGFAAIAGMIPSVRYQPWVFPNGESVIVEFLHAGPGNVAGYEVYGRIERSNSIDATEAALRTLAGA